MKYLRFAFILLILNGCATFGEYKPETLREHLVVAEYSYQGVLNTVDRLITSGLITRVQAPNVIKMLDNSKIALDNARIAVELSQIDSMSKIQFANTSLTILIVFLQEREQ